MGPGALETALALYQAPSLAAATRLRPVPADVFEVIRIAAGDQDATDAAIARSGSDASVVREASQLYLKQALFHPDADHYRVLGVAPDASHEQLREHRRWLLKWLHPDRSDEWDAVYASRIQQAWQRLRDPVRRADYDAALAQDDDWAAPLVPGALRPVWTPRALANEPAERQASSPLRWGVPIAVALVVAGVAWMAWPTPTPKGRAVPAQASAVPDVPRVVVLEPVPYVAPFADDAPSPEAMRTAATGQASDRVVRPVADPVSPRPQLATEPPPAQRGTPTAPVAVPATPAPGPAAAAVAPAAPPDATMATATPAPAPIPRDDIRELMTRFQQTYEDGDIDVLMTLFSNDARNRRGGVEAIREDYARLFRSSRQRSLQWHSMDWQRDTDHALGEGGFVAVITPRRGGPNEVRGSVRVEVVQEAGQTRIRELWHEDHRP